MTTASQPIPGGPPPYRALRWATAGAAMGAALAHVPVIGPHLTEVPVMGVLFILFSAACVIGALAVLVRDANWIYGALAVLCTGAIITFVATRVIAFPGLADDIGSWTAPPGIAALAFAWPSQHLGRLRPARSTHRPLRH